MSKKDLAQFPTCPHCKELVVQGERTGKGWFHPACYWQHFSGGAIRTRKVGA